MMSRRPFLPILALFFATLLLAACVDQRTRNAFSENEGVRLMVGRDITFTYDPATCQLAFSRDLREFRGSFNCGSQRSCFFGNDNFSVGCCIFFRSNYCSGFIESGKVDAFNCFVVTFTELPAAFGQFVTADLTWTTERDVLTRKNLTLEVIRVEGDQFWLWSDTGRIGLCMRILE